MSKVRIKLKIDVTKIEKDRLFKGKKGTYLDASVLVDLDQQGKYGDNGMITQEISKEEREAGEMGAILGNCLVVWRETAQEPAGPDEGDGPYLLF